jgi:hypothetical protein
MERTGLAMTSIQKGLQIAQAQGLIDRDWTRVWPTAKGFDFLSDLQSLFLPDPPESGLNGGSVMAGTGGQAPT